MIQRGNLLFRHPGEGRDLFLPWAPAFAGVSALIRCRPVNRLSGSVH